MKIHSMTKTLAIRKYRKVLSITLASLLLASSFPVNGGTSLAKSAQARLGAAAQSGLGSPLPFPFNGALSASASTFPTLAAAPGSNFAVLIGSTSGGDSFGDEPGSVGGRYRGLEFLYPEFNLDGVDPNRNGVLALASRSVATSCNRVEINGVQIPILRDHNDSGVWETEIFRIPTGVLKASGNTLFIKSLNESCTTGGNEDDFVVSNVVLHYALQ